MKEEKKIIAVSIAAGVAVWLADSALDFVRFYKGEGSFFDLLFLRVPHHELYIRSLICLIFIVFGLIASGYVRRIREEEEKAWEAGVWFSTVLGSIGDGVVATDMEGRVTFMNPVAEKLTGWTTTDAVGKLLQEVFVIINEESRKPVKNPVDIVMQKGIIVGLANHTLLISKDGSETPIADSAAPIRLDGGDMRGVVLIFRDDSERRDREKALSNAERRFRLMFDNMSNCVAVYEVAEDGESLIIRGFNAAAERTENVKREDIIGRELREVFPGVVEFGLYDVFLKVFRTGDAKHHPMSFYEDDRLKGWRDNYVYKLPTGEIVAIYQDVTEKKQAEFALRDREQWLSTALSSMGDGVIIAGRDRGVDFMNPVAEDLTGVSLKQAEGRRLGEIFRIVSEKDGVPMDSVLEAVDRGETLAISNSAVLVSSKGGETPIDYTVAPLRSLDGNIFGMVIIFRDITERKRSVQALKESEERFRAVFEASEDSIVVVHKNYEIAYANGTAVERMGMEGRRVVGMNFLEPIGRYPQFTAMWKERIETVFRTGEGIMVEDENELDDGRIVSTESMITPARDTMGETFAVAVVHRDLTKRKQMEREKEHLGKQLLQAQKMESVGTLAGGIAHDFNNMLAIILGNAQMALVDIPESGPGRQELVDIEIAARRARELTSKLLTFSRSGHINFKTVDPGNIVLEVSEMLKRVIPGKIVIKTNIEKGSPLVDMDTNQFHQALMNICTNARDAMPDGGIISISCSGQDLDEAFCESRPDMEPGRYCRITVSDQGVGMSPGVAAQVFEPFFTTKGVGEGTGLGLSTTHGIVRGHRGWIDLDSEPGEGTVVNIYIPASHKEADMNEVELGDMDLLGTGTVLVVDDEQPVLKLAGIMLSRAGYETILAGTGTEAVRIYSERGNEIDIVLLDIMMPEMDGEDVFNALKRLNPDVKVILLSGYSVEGKASSIINGGALNYIQKPFTVEELCGVVKREISDV